jgi:SAC3/GANP family
LDYSRRIRLLIQDITERSEIKIALNIHRALLVNNTTKFFSLIENQATLLQCCLLNRYFNIIRLKRLTSLNASTSIRNSDEVRLSDLTDILGMDSDKDTKDYLEQLGYILSTTDPSFVVVPSTENPMEQSQPVMKLSQRLIKSKYRGNLKDVSMNLLFSKKIEWM